MKKLYSVFLIIPFFLFLVFNMISDSFSQPDITQEDVVLLAKDSGFALVVHGGAGTILKKNMTDEREKEYNDKLTEALNAGYQVLKKGGSSLDAAISSVKILEDSPLFNAGKGSVLTNEGTVEMDASVMDGKTLNAGAVAGVKTIKNPILAARLVMEKSPHVMLMGKGADDYARKNGLETANPEYFIDSLRYRQWKKLVEEEKAKDDRGGLLLPPVIEPGLQVGQKYGTVGAVALDKQGNLAAATSTGGMMNKRYGRIGDSPIIGAGTYAGNKTCAVSCTGHGEYFIRLSVARDVSALMEYKGLSLEQASNEVIHKKLPEIGGSGGLIAIDNKGNIAMPFNTEGMYRGYIKEDGKAVVKIYKE